MPSAALPSPADPASYRALTRPPNARYIEVIDQRALPHALVKVKIGDAEAAALAIRRMWVRGAPLIGAVGAYGLALALDRDSGDAALAKAQFEFDKFRAIEDAKPQPVDVDFENAIEQAKQIAATQAKPK